MSNTKTDAEISELKRQWYEDPCWDLETTEGFEAHHDELKAFSEDCKAESEAMYDKMVVDASAKMGILGLTKLTVYIMNLEHTIEKLEERIDKLEQ